jgi:hypothetical protein
MKRKWKVLLILSDIVAWLFLLLAASFLVQYIYESENPLRHELGIGMVTGFSYGVWPALFSLTVSICYRSKIKGWLFLVSVAILPAFGIVLGTYNAIAT